VQTGGIDHFWQSPDGEFKHVFLQLDLGCEPDKHPGIVIIADECYQHAFAAVVQDLQRELPALLQRMQGRSVVYWWFERDQKQLTTILTSLTEHPVFADNR
jgi:hypothetical protein